MDICLLLLTKGDSLLTKLLPGKEEGTEGTSLSVAVAEIVWVRHSVTAEKISSMKMTLLRNAIVLVAFPRGKPREHCGGLSPHADAFPDCVETGDLPCRWTSLEPG